MSFLPSSAFSVPPVAVEWSFWRFPATRIQLDFVILLVIICITLVFSLLILRLPFAQLMPGFCFCLEYVVISGKVDICRLHKPSHKVELLGSSVYLSYLIFHLSHYPSTIIIKIFFFGDSKQFWRSAVLIAKLSGSFLMWTTCVTRWGLVQVLDQLYEFWWDYIVLH